ncbi:MAG: MBL fold metallo-hydrolase [Chloroflexota bacterium]
MQIIEVKPCIYAVDRPGPTSNLGMIRTPDGVIFIDATSNEKEMGLVLSKAGLTPDNVCLLIVTHADGDHIGGASLFDCKVVAHKMTAARMELTRKIKASQPLETFEDELYLEFGGYHFHLTHFGGHKPDLIVAWMPEQKVLFPADLVFTGRYPWIQGGDITAWIEGLKKLPGYGAEVILPGHGTLCGEAEIALLRDYLSDTWERTREHVLAGRSIKEALADRGYPQIEGWDREELRERNIEVIYELLYEEFG